MTHSILDHTRLPREWEFPTGVVEGLHFDKGYLSPYFVTETSSTFIGCSFLDPIRAHLH